MPSTNTFANPTVFAKELAYQVRNNLKFAATVYRAESDFNPVNGWKPGSAVRIRVPTKFQVGTTASVASGVNHIDVHRTVTVDQVRNVVLEYTSAQLTQDTPAAQDRFRDTVITPAAIRLANSIDSYMAGIAKAQVAQTYVSTAGTVNSLGHLFGARRYLVEAGAPAEGNYLALHPGHVASLGPVLGTLYNNSYTDPLLKTGMLAKTTGATVWESQNMQSQTFGTITGGSAVLEATWTLGTAPSTGTIELGTVTISVTGTIQPGAVFTQATLYGVKALSEGAAQSTGQLKQFVFAGTGAAGTPMTTGTGAALFYTQPIGNGPYQNVTGATGGTIATVASAAVLVFVAGTGNAVHPQSLLYNPNAFALASVPLYLPDGASWKAQETVDGITVRLVKSYNGLSDIEVTRADVLFGGITLNPDLACKIV